MQTPLLPVVFGTPSLRATSAPIPTEGGCGLTNHPNGAMYSNSTAGIFKLDTSTGAALGGPFGPPGNALGIAVDPVNQHLIFAGEDCHELLVSSPTTCTLWDLDPNSPNATPVPFAIFPHAKCRSWTASTSIRPASSSSSPIGPRPPLKPRTGDFLLNSLTIVSRPTQPVTASSVDQIVQHLPMASEPDGVSFHSIDKFVVTNDEAGGTMTRFDFPGGDFSQQPASYFEIQPIDGDGEPVGAPIRLYGTSFASGGHRGDLSQVGPDGCIYVTQGRNLEVTDFGTRYDDLTETSEDSVVRICSTSGGGFEPPPGVKGDSVPGSIAGSAYLDMNGNHAIDAGDQFLALVPLALSGASSASANSSAGPAPAYMFDALTAGAYSVSAPAPFSGYALSASTPGSVNATITAAGEQVTGIDFLYEPGTLTGSVYLDADDDGGFSGGDTFLSGVGVGLSGQSMAATTSGSGPTPTYSFIGLQGGNYAVNVPGVFAGYKLATPAPQSRTVAPGGSQAGVNFLYVRGRISGFAYVDANGNSVKDAGEAPLSGVTITLAGVGMTTTAADGSYSFKGLAANGYSASASTPASGYALSTPSPLAPNVVAGGHVQDVNFGYRSPQVPGLSIVKTSSVGNYTSVGQTIVYTYQVTNTGSVALNGPFTVTDDKLGSFSCGAAGSLAPGASISCTKNYVIQPKDLGNVVALPTGVVATVDTGQWLGGVMSTQDTTISNAGAGVPSGIYPGWCIQDYVPTDLHNQPGTLYSTIGGSLPADVAGIAWGKVNWVLNHKIRAPGANDTQFFKDVQTAVWVSVGEKNPEFGISPTAQQMITAANQHPDYVPGPGDVVAVIIYSDGMTIFPGSIQESIIEMKLLQSITNDAVVTTSYAGQPVSSAHTQVTIRQAPAPVYVTYTQGGWGATPNGNNPAMLLQNNFAAIYGSAGVTIGITATSGRYYLKFTSSSAIRNFLPAGGTPKVLKASATNPTSSAAGVLAGQVLALRLAVDFSASGKTTAGLGALKVAPGNALAGQTVLQVLAIANQVLGGNTGALPSGMSTSGLNDVITRINENFDNGTTNKGYLVP